MSATYLRALAQAERDMQEALDLLRGHAGDLELTVTELMQALGLATVAQKALLRAAKARHTEGGPQA